MSAHIDTRKYCFGRVLSGRIEGMSKRMEIGYLCHRGHFQFHDDPDGDSCQTKIIGKVYVKPIRGAYKDMFKEAIGWAVEHLHTQIEFWRKNA